MLEDLAISLSRRYGINAAERPANLSSDEHDDTWRTYRTLVHLQWYVTMYMDNPQPSRLMEDQLA